MWILEHEGEAFRGKKLWLQPGKKHLIGRTKNEGAKFAIFDKTISKTHLTVEVDHVEPGNCQNPRKRSRVVLEDLGSKIGTLANDEQIRGTRYEIQKDYNEIKLGRHKYLFKIIWIPVTLTFSFTGKEAKADPFTKLYETLGPLDIKVLATYERGQTTHVVAKKRNTSKGLQALIDGKFIVNDAFTEAVIKAAEAPPIPPAAGEEQDGESGPPPEPVSPLEEDFEGNFPKALEYLPPRGQEPTQRPSEAYAPNHSRQNMFEGYTYIFYDQSQFNNLLAPITEGRGKAVIREVIPNETTVNEFVGYVKGVAGEKGLGEFEDGSEGKGVVVVKYSPAKSTISAWFEKFCQEVAMHLDHRLIEQSEFLDAILNNDASVLRRPLSYEQSDIMAPPPSSATAMTSQTMRSSPPPDPTPAKPVEVAPVRKGRVRRTVASRFKGFDDDDFESLSHSVPQPIEVSQAPALVGSQSQGMFVSQDPQEMDVDSQPGETQTRSSLKRKTPPVEEESEEDIMEQIAPAAAARKRRREADEAERRRRGESIHSPVVAQKPAAPATKKPKKQKKVEEIDVQQELARRREREKEIAEAETQALQDQLDGMDIEQIRNLVIIEEIEVKRSAPPPRSRAHGEEGDRWDDKWNGRKNFKKFRPKGQSGPRNLNRVIVPLEEVKKRDYGIGDEYWLEGDAGECSKKKKGKGKETQGVSQSQSQPQSRPRSRATEKSVMEVPVVNDESSSEDDVTPREAPKVTTAAATSRSQPVVDKTGVTQNTSQNKRPATTTLTKPAPAKKARQAIREPESDNDSEDELKFRFRKKK